MDNSSPIEKRFNEYQAWLTDQPLSDHTKRAYVSRIKQFLKFASQKKAADAADGETTISPLTVQSYTEFLKNYQNAEPRSVNNSLTAIDNFCQFLGIERSNIQRERTSPLVPRTLTQQEQATFLSLVQRRSLRDQAMALLFLDSGIRPGECVALNVCDVIESAGSTKLLIRGNNSREVLLNPQTRDALHAWLEKRKQIVSNSSEEAVFVNLQGGRLSMAGIDLVIRNIGWSANIEVSAQVLRHTCLSNLANSGRDLLTLAKIAGHKSLDTTRRYCALPSASSAKHKSLDSLMIGSTLWS